MKLDVEPKGVIELYESHSPHGDAKTIASALGFNNHREMAEFMLNKGFLWDSDKGNYYEELDLNQLAQMGSDARMSSISEYLPLLKWLKSNEVELRALLEVDFSEDFPVEDAISRKIQISKDLNNLLIAYCHDHELRPSSVVSLALSSFLKV